MLVKFLKDGIWCIEELHNIKEHLFSKNIMDEENSSAHLNDDERECFEERAAILEYMDDLSKEEAERIARERIILRRKIWN
jgi:hypothetical protein